MCRRAIAAVVVAMAAAAGAAEGQSALSLGPLFQDHAVFQRDRPIPVWGTAGPGDEVTVVVRREPGHRPRGRVGAMDGDTAGDGRRRSSWPRGAHDVRRHPDALGHPRRRRLPLLRAVEHGVRRGPVPRRRVRGRAVSERQDSPAHHRARGGASACRRIREGAGVAECRPAEPSHLLGGLLLLRPRRARDAERPGGARERRVGRVGDRALDRRGRPAGHRRFRRPSRHAAHLRAR